MPGWPQAPPPDHNPTAENLPTRSEDRLAFWLVNTHHRRRAGEAAEMQAYTESLHLDARGCGGHGQRSAAAAAPASAAVRLALTALTMLLSRMDRPLMGDTSGPGRPVILPARADV